jgi:hypothetical protein
VVVISKANIYPGTFFKVEIPASQNSGWVPRENLEFNIDMDQVPEELVTPLPAATPTPLPTSLAGPVSTLSPEEQEFARRMVKAEPLHRVCSFREGIPDAAGYNSEEAGIHPVLMVSVVDEGLIRLPVPDRWRSTSIRDIELGVTKIS